MALPTSLTKPLRRTQHTSLPLKNMTFTATTLQAPSARVSHAFSQLQAKKSTGWNINSNYLIAWVSFPKRTTSPMITGHRGLRVGWFWTFWGMRRMCWITLHLLKKDMSQRNIKIHKAAAAKVHSLFFFFLYRKLYQLMRSTADNGFKKSPRYRIHVPWLRTRNPFQGRPLRS